MSEELYDIYNNAKDMTMDEAYAYCQELEEKRWWSKRQYSQGRFESSMQSYDCLIESFEDSSKIQMLSDKGKGEEDILASEGTEAITIALGKLPASDKAFAEAVLQGKKWEEMGISEPTFYRRLKKVEKIFRESDSHPPKTVA